jgi:hypothetical protein
MAAVTSWAASPTYGRSVMLGPAQRDVLAVALRLTTHGRRPELTLGRLADLSGRPVSSVHDALGRLRALGILGVSARMGRHGGHRIWRVTARGTRSLGDGAHRVAVARILRRWYAATTQAIAAVPRPLWPTASDPTPPVGSDAATVPDGSGNGGRDSVHPDPFGVKPSDWTPGPEGESFGAKLRRYGLGTWIDERDHDAETT